MNARTVSFSIFHAAKNIRTSASRNLMVLRLNGRAHKLVPSDGFRAWAWKVFPTGEGCTNECTVRSLKGHRVIYGERLDPSLMQPIISVAARYGIIPKAFPAGDMIADLA